MGLHADSWALAFGLRKQTDIRTALANAHIDKMRPQRNFAPFKVPRTQVVSDANRYGKGHGFPTFRSTIETQVTLDAQERDATDLELLFALYLVMGGLSSTNPTGAKWLHTLTWADAVAGIEVPYTTMGESTGTGSAPGYKKLAVGAWLSQCTIRGEMNDHCTLSFQGGAREYAASTLTHPTNPSASSFLITRRATLKIGPTGAQTSIDGEWASFELTFNQNAVAKARSGQPAGEEKYVHAVHRGKQVVTGSCLLELRDTYRNYFLNETEISLEIELRSADLIEGVQKSAVILLKNVKIAEEAFETEDSTIMYRITLNETSVLKTQASHVSAVITTDITDAEIGKTGGTQQVETATVAGTVTLAGNATFTVTAAGMSNSPKVVNVPVLLNDTAAMVADRAEPVLRGDPDVGNFWDISELGEQVIFTKKAAAANDATANIAIANGTCTGLTPAPTSADTVAGVAPA